ncbi:MAG: hypothetical protein DRN66_00205 [Candidatus Nanohalarchaeota archaeon]|nr:MAG: hypothetical protein DRN66_00205 [Candidatus Nanohaloarchaeota archaeon]
MKNGKVKNTGFNAEKTKKVFSFLRDTSGHLKNLWFGLAVSFMIIILTGISFGISNPSAAYCTEMGYNYEVTTGSDGSQDGVCVISDNAKFNAWDFLNGKTGQEFSYCAKHGYDIKTIKTGNSYSSEYAICIPKKNKVDFTKISSGFLNKNNMVPMIEMMGLDEKISYAFKPDLANAKKVKDKSFGASSLVVGNGNIHSYYDWRNYNNENWMTPVKDQASCGSCWAFSAVGAVEAKYNIDQNNSQLNPDLSEQYLVSDCCAYCGDCDGGNQIVALDYIKEDGISDEFCFPYNKSNSNCNGKCSDWNARLWDLSGSNYTVYYSDFSNDELKNWISYYGPLPIAIDMDNGDDWDGDIYRCNEEGDLNHAVVLTGYNDTGNDTTSYWIVKNSWGSSWNGDGYFKIGFNECNVTDYFNYVDAVNPPNLNPIIVLNSPSNDHTENSNRTIFNFTVYNHISENSTCNLVINGTVENSTNAINATSTIMSHELSDGTYSWNVECWENRIGVANSSETRSLNVDITVFYISGCRELNKTGAAYYLTADILDSSAEICMDVTANNITLDCRNHKIAGISLEPSYAVRISRGSSTNTTSLIKNCIVTDWDRGVYLRRSGLNKILNITALSNNYGIYLSQANVNTIKNSTIVNNLEYGIYLYQSGAQVPNLIYNNYFDNTNNAWDNGNNDWNITNQTETNIIGGPYIGGNYFSDFNTPDSNGDGFVDYPHNISGGSNTDYLPLAIPEVPTIFLSIGLMFLSLAVGRNKINI